MPLKKPYGTARGTTRSATNFLIEINGSVGKRTYRGLGESQPRHVLTGDGPRGSQVAWTFLKRAAETLEGRSISVESGGSSLHAIVELMGELDQLAARYADASNAQKPFRGTQLGVEVALLDILSRAHGMEIAELLGKHRQRLAITISTISSTADLATVDDRVRKQRRYKVTRVKGVEDIEYDWRLLETVARANQSKGWQKPIWMDINEAFDLPMAKEFLLGVVERMSKSLLPSTLIVEGMLPKDQVTELPRLQKAADQACEAATGDEKLDLRIMPDEGLWDTADLAKVNAKGGCRALNIKAPKAGGILPSIQLAQTAIADGRDIHVGIGGMVGTSDITAFALHNLARSVPRLDYLTAVPPGNVERRIGVPKSRFINRNSDLIARQVTTGLGTQLDIAAVEPYIVDTYVSGNDMGEGMVTGLNYKLRPVGTGNDDSGSKTTLVFAGDTSLGDVHLTNKGGENLRRLREDPMSFFASVRPLVEDAEFVTLNFESVLAKDPVSPLAGRKKYLGWDSPERTLSCLSELGVDSVSLANNHTMDFGGEVLLQTRSKLEMAGISVGGAGHNRADSAAPVSLQIWAGREQRWVHIISGMEVQRKLRDEYYFYAGPQRVGVYGLARERISQSIARIRATDPSSLIILYPHWGLNYRWSGGSMRRLRATFLESGADIVVGHGAHALQECVLGENDVTVFSLGNFVFNWAGRFNQFEVPPYGLVARLEVVPLESGWRIRMKLYPILSDNRRTKFMPRPVTGPEFDEVMEALRRRDLDGSFRLRAEACLDSLGHHIGYEFNTASHFNTSHTE